MRCGQYIKETNLSSAGGFVPFTGGFRLRCFRLSGRAFTARHDWRAIVGWPTLLLHGLGILTLYVRVWRRDFAVDDVHFMAMLQAGVRLIPSLERDLAFASQRRDEVLVEDVSMLVTELDSRLATLEMRVFGLGSDAGSVFLLVLGNLGVGLPLRRCLLRVGRNGFGNIMDWSHVFTELRLVSPGSPSSPVVGAAIPEHLHHCGMSCNQSPRYPAT